MANPKKPTITITVSGPTGSGKTHILATIASMFIFRFTECVPDFTGISEEMKLCGAHEKPQKDTIIKFEERNEPLQKAVPAELFSQAINMKSLSAEGILDIFKGYGFTDQHGNKLESCEHFHALVEMATKPAHIIQSSAVNIGGNIQITADEIIGKRCPVHIQELLAKLGIGIQHYQETDLTPLLELVNWALSEKTDKADAKSLTVNRGDLANQLIDVLEPHCKSFSEVKMVEAAVLALFTVMHPAQAAREIREIIGS